MQVFICLIEEYLNLSETTRIHLKIKLYLESIKSKKITIKYTLANMWYPMDTIKDKNY